MKYWDLFLNLVNEKHIHVVVLIPPYSSYFRHGIKVNGFEKKWNNIIEEITSRNIILWNLIDLFKESVPRNYFLDENHATKEGRMYLSKILGKKLVTL
tara:strand:- start:1398 stop:1691 length:294 start_codon:yes stop_codon:yes gene_type:complete